MTTPSPGQEIGLRQAELFNRLHFHGSPLFRLRPGAAWRFVQGMKPPAPPMPMEPHAALRREVPSLLLQRLPGLLAVLQFGSSVASTPQVHRDSDVDLAVLGVGRYATEVLRHLAGECGSLVGVTVDLVDLRAADTVFAMQILSSGRLLLDVAPTEFARFENRRCSEYLAFNEERREILADIVARGAVYG